MQEMKQERKEGGKLERVNMEIIKWAGNKEFLWSYNSLGLLSYGFAA